MSKLSMVLALAAGTDAPSLFAETVSFGYGTTN
jgi:hypothetical protein